MATNANWTVVFEDKIIIKNYDLKELMKVLVIKLMMILFGINLNFLIFGLFNTGTSNTSDEVEYRDETPHSSFGQMQTLEILVNLHLIWDAAHLAQLQSNWDNDNVDGETEAEKKLLD
jgi:hypothetical protein